MDATSRPTPVHKKLCKFINIQGAAEKSGPLKFFAVFSATVWNFNLKFYRFIYENLSLNKVVKFHIKIPNGCRENGKKL